MIPLYCIVDCKPIPEERVRRGAKTCDKECQRLYRRAFLLDRKERYRKAAGLPPSPKSSSGQRNSVPELSTLKSRGNRGHRLSDTLSSTGRTLRLTTARAKAYPIARAKTLNMEISILFFAARNRYEKSSTNIEPINVRSIARMLLHMTKVRGLQRMHPHLLRHGCATHMLDNGCPLDVIAQILGHDNLDVTAHYAQVSTRLMMDTYNAAHPHAKVAA